jgi:DHA1 family multidrug resistance protein-like MFS transporter/DHA1 family quinolone resistance protein-like MFS transporter
MIVFNCVNDYNDIMKPNRNFQSGILYSTALFGQLSLGITMLGLVYFMRDRHGLSTQFIGLFASVQTISYFLGCTFLKSITSRLKPRHAVEIGTGGMALFGAGIVFAGQPYIAFILYIFFGLALSFFWPPLMGWLTRGLEGSQLSKVIAMFNLSWSTGLIIAPYISGLLTEQGSSFPLLAGSFIFAAVFIMILSATLVLPGIRAASSSRKLVADSGGEDHSTPLRYFAWAGLFSCYIIFGISMNIFPLYARELLGYTESAVGLILLVRGLLTTIVFVLLGKGTWWHFSLFQIRAQQLLLTLVAILGMFSSSLLSLVIFFFLYGILFAGMYTNSIFHGAAGSLDRESRMAVHEAVLAAGIIIGSFFGGVIYENYDFTIVMGAGAAVAGLVFLIQLLPVRNPEGEQEVGQG